MLQNVVVKSLQIFGGVLAAFLTGLLLVTSGIVPVLVILGSAVALSVIGLVVWGVASEWAAGGYDRDYAAPLVTSKSYRAVTSRYEQAFPAPPTRPRSVVFPRVNAIPAARDAWAA